MRFTLVYRWGDPVADAPRRDLIDVWAVVRTVSGMNPVDGPGMGGTLRVDIDRSYRFWVDDARSRLAAVPDRELFDQCLDAGVGLNPYTVVLNLEATHIFACNKIVDAAQWEAVIDFVEEQTETPASASFAEFARAVESDLHQRSGQPRERMMVDMVDLGDGTAQTSIGFTVEEVFFWFGLEEEVSSMTYRRGNESALGRLTVEGPGWSRNFVLHVARDEVRDFLAQHHFETVLEGEDSIIPYLNEASDERCSALYALALDHPDDDVRVLERRLGTGSR